MRVATYNKQLRGGECYVDSQCDQMDILFFNLWPFTILNICSVAIVICQIQNKPAKNCPRLFKSNQSGTICQIWSHWPWEWNLTNRVVGKALDGKANDLKVKPLVQNTLTDWAI